MSDQTYDRESSPIQKIFRFMQTIEKAYSDIDPQDMFGKKFETVVRSLSPKADTEILGTAPDLADMPTKLDNNDR
jgi:hypothetical protein